MDAQEADTNSALAHTYEYLTKSIPSLSTNLEYLHRLLAVIKTSTQKEAGIYIANVSTLHLFIMLYIDNIFDKIKTLPQNNSLCPSSDTPEENSHYGFGYSSSDVYSPPCPHDFTVELLDNIKDFMVPIPLVISCISSQIISSPSGETSIFLLVIPNTLFLTHKGSFCTGLTPGSLP